MCGQSILFYVVIAVCIQVLVRMLINDFLSMLA
jgi:hypothetical protein